MNQIIKFLWYKLPQIQIIDLRQNPDADPVRIKLSWPKGMENKMKLNRAFSLIEVKAIDEDERTIEGVATTPQPDRMGDVVDPKGAEFNLPIPLLLHHNSREPIGQIIKAKVDKDGIIVTAKIAKATEAGRLKDRLDEAWQSIKLGLIKGLSIGFKVLEKEPLNKDSDDPFELIFGPFKFTKWLWLELSAVTIPANEEATITAVKSIGNQELTALGLRKIPPVRLQASPSSVLDISIHKRETIDMGTKTISEQISALEATRAAKAARMEEIMQKSIDEGRSTDEQEREEFDTLDKEVETIDGDLKRLRALEKAQASGAKPVSSKPREATQSRTEQDRVIVRDVRESVQKPGPGIRFARLVKCLGLAQGNRFNAAQIAEQVYGKSDPIIVDVMKANVAAGTTLAGNWAEGLVGTETTVFADFVEYLRPQTIVGRFGAGGIPALRAVPFRTALVSQVGGGAGYWVGEGKAKPLTSFDFGRTTLEPLKVANICVITDELIKSSSPSAEAIIRDSLVAALRERLDLDFINPDKAAVANVSPASILNGVTGLVSSGNDADAIRQDLSTIFGSFIDANNAPTAGVWIMSARLALTLSLMMNPLGQPEFPGINMNGGTFAGLPVITSEYVTFGTSGDFVALVNASDIYIADEGELGVDMSREASLEMSDAPAHNATTPTAAQLVSLWQTNSVGFRAERTINWKRRRAEGVAWMANIHWGEAVT